MTEHPVETLAAMPGVDAIGIDGRARVVQRVIAPFQDQRYELAIIQATNKMDDDDLVPGLPAGPDGVPSFRERREQLLKLEADVIASCEPRVIDRLREMTQG